MSFGTKSLIEFGEGSKDPSLWSRTGFKSTPERNRLPNLAHLNSSRNFLDRIKKPPFLGICVLNIPLQMLKNLLYDWVCKFHSSRRSLPHLRISGFGSYIVLRQTHPSVLELTRLNLTVQN